MSQIEPPEPSNLSKVVIFLVVLALVAVAVIVILALVGPQLGNVYPNVVKDL